MFTDVNYYDLSFKPFVAQLTDSTLTTTYATLTVDNTVTTYTNTVLLYPYTEQVLNIAGQFADADSPRTGNAIEINDTTVTLPAYVELFPLGAVNDQLQWAFEAGGGNGSGGMGYTGPVNFIVGVQFSNCQLTVQSGQANFTNGACIGYTVVLPCAFMEGSPTVSLPEGTAGALTTNMAVANATALGGDALILSIDATDDTIVLDDAAIATIEDSPTDFTGDAF